MTCDLFICAGEASGDLYGAQLLQALYAVCPNLNVKGVGGPKMRATGMDCFMPMEKLAVMGCVDVFFNLPQLISYFKAVKKEILATQPRVLVCIDFPSFNLRLANALYKKRLPTKRIHYICPAVWAWGKGRIPKMERILDCLLVVFPFEPNLFSQETLRLLYVGHPVISQIASHKYDDHWKEKCGIPVHKPILSIFPGSRKKEVMRNFPLQLNAAKRIQHRYPDLVIAISCFDKAFLPLLDKNCVIVDSQYSYELMRASHLSITTMGTVVLELALHCVPTVATFSLHSIDLFIARRLLRIDLPYYALPNIVKQREIFPELVGHFCTEEAIYEKGVELFGDKDKRSICIEQCRDIKKILGEKNASLESVKVILEYLYASGYELKNHRR